jgi:hypothetical protein
MKLDIHEDGTLHNHRCENLKFYIDIRVPCNVTCPRGVRIGNELQICQPVEAKSTNVIIVKERH